LFKAPRTSWTHFARVPGFPFLPAVSWFTTVHVSFGNDAQNVLFPEPGAPLKTSTIGRRNPYFKGSVRGSMTFA
jgi:hypothetical protein